MKKLKDFLREQEQQAYPVKGKPIKPDDPRLKNITVIEPATDEQIFNWLKQTKALREKQGIPTDIQPYLKKLAIPNIKEAAEWTQAPCGVIALAGIFNVSPHKLFYDMDYAKYWRIENTNYTHLMIKFMVENGKKVFEILWSKDKPVKPFATKPTTHEGYYDMRFFGIKGNQAIKLIFQHIENAQNYAFFVDTTCGDGPFASGHTMSLARGRRYDTLPGYTNRCNCRFSMLVE